MSHVATLKTKKGEPVITDLHTVAMAAAEMGLLCEERSNYYWWKDQTGRGSEGDFAVAQGFTTEELGNNAVLVLALPPEKIKELGGYGDKTYELAIVKDPNNPGCYVPMYDFWGGRYLEQIIGSPVLPDAGTGYADQIAPKFMMHYHMCADKLTAQEMGDQIAFEEQEDGSYVSYTVANEERMRE